MPLILPNVFANPFDRNRNRADKKLTAKQFYAYEAQYPEQKFELANGQIIAMAGASGNHATICMNLANQIYNHFDRNDSPCQVYQSDIRLKINENTIRYPDVLVDCGGTIHMEATNVVLTAEVLSKSTAYIDLRQKIDEYKSLASMQEIVMIDQYNVWVQLYRKVGENWTVQTFTDMSDAVDFKSINLSLTVDKLYKKVVF